MEVVRAWQYPDGADRLVPSPVFVLGSMRSGATALCKMLDLNSRICAPHEMHLGRWRVETDSQNAHSALQAMGLTPGDLANLLWDRVLHLELVRSGKSIIVDKTPRNTLLWRRIGEVWPDGRFLILLRHPAHVAESLRSAHPDIPADTHYANLERYAQALSDAQREAHHAMTVRYEDLTADPEATTKRITEWLDIPWEPAMAAATAVPEAALPEPDPHQIPTELRTSCELLGYL